MMRARWTGTAAEVGLALAVAAAGFYITATATLENAGCPWGSGPLAFRSKSPAPQEAGPSPFDVPTEGYGKVTGGEGKPVVEVTTTSLTGPGSLTEALSGGDRIVRFKVGGTFKLDQKLTVSHANVTIDGRDAPAPGVNFTGKERLLIASNNVILRNLRFRGMGGDGIACQGDGIIVDHCSVSDTKDGSIDMTDWQKTGKVKNCTISYCILGPTNKVQLNSVLPTASVHHTIFYKGVQRNPQYNAGACGDVRNCIVYGWKGEGIDINAGSTVNVIRNVFFQLGQPKRGPLRADGQVYAEGNVGNVDIAKGSASTPYAEPKVTTQPALEAAKLVLEKSGCWPRDDVDRKIVSEIQGALAGLSDKPPKK